MRILKACVVVLLVALAGTRFGEVHFLLDNLSNFPLHLGAAFLACGAALAIGRAPSWAVAAVVGVAISLSPVFPWYFSKNADASPATTASVKLLVSNVYLHNRQHERLLSLIKQVKPDVIGLVEVNSRWLAHMAPLSWEYPYRFEMPDEAYAGIALYSRLPLDNARLLKLDQVAVPAITTVLRTPAGPIDLLLAHPFPPLSGEHVRKRNAQLAALAGHVRKAERPVVMAGDLNVTMWNRNYRRLADEAGLKNARAGHGVGSTWPPVRAFGVPIDHILATDTVEFRNFAVHASIGSDHLPISAEFSLRPRHVP